MSDSPLPLTQGISSSPFVRTSAKPSLRLSGALARFSDDLVTIPGTTIGLGADAVVGLIPGIGDLLGTGLSTTIMVDAVRNRVPLPVLARMGCNMLFDAGLGLAPVVGDAADVLHRANRKNYRLLEKTVAEGRRVEASVPGYIALAVATVAGFLLASLAVTAFIVWGLIGFLSGFFG